MSKPFKHDHAAKAFLFSYTLEHGKRPSMQAICDAVGWKSKRSAQLFLKRLVDEGLIEIKNNREIQLLTVSEQTRSTLNGLADIRKQIALIRKDTAKALMKLATDLAVLAQKVQEP